jgi:hypothetical protein
VAGGATDSADRATGGAGEDARKARVTGAAPLIGLLVAAYLVTGLLTFHRTLLPDEIRPLLLADRPLAEQMDIARGDLVQTPASYLLARAWIAPFADKDAAAKSLALVLGAATITLFALLSKRVTPDWRIAAVLCCAMYMRPGTSPNLVRMYGLLILCAVAALLIWDAWRSRPRWPLLAGWCAVMATALYTHLSALLLLGAMVVTTWVLGPRRRSFTVAASITVLTLIPWLVYVFPVFQERGIQANVGAIAEEPVRALFRLPFFLLTGDSPGVASPLEEAYSVGIPRPLPWLALVLIGALIAAALPAAIRNWRPRVANRTRQDDWGIASFGMVLLPTLVLFAFSLGVEPVVTARYLLVCLPAVWLMLEYAGRTGGRPGKWLLWIITGWVILSAAYVTRLHIPVSPARAAMDFLDAERRETDRVVAARHTAIGWQVYWEWTRRLGRTEAIDILPSPQPEWLSGIVPARSLDAIDLASAGRVWYIDLGRRSAETIVAPLAAHGFVPEDYGAQDLPWLRLFVKQTTATPQNPDGPTARH